MTGSLLRSYEGQIKIFLVLLVLFLAVALYFNFHLLVVARNALQDEAGQRMALEADLVRVELERDQMLRGLGASPGVPPYIPPTYLERMARLKGMSAIEILTLQGRVISSSEGARVGAQDEVIGGRDDAPRSRLLSGGSVLTTLDRPGREPWGTLAAYRPIQDRSRAAVAVIRVEQEVPVLASVDLNLKTIAALQTGGLVLVLVLVAFFARWLLQPYRRLAAAAGEAPGLLRAAGPGAAGEPDYLVSAFQGVLDKLHEQEQELGQLRARGGETGATLLPGEQLIRGLGSAVLVFDREGRLTVLNGAAEGLFGLTHGSAVGRSYHDLFGENTRLGELLSRSLGTGASHSREVVSIEGPGGRTAHLGAMIAPILSDRAGMEGAVEGVVCLLADLTEIKALRERVGLKENLAALGEMSAGIAHEFRNSLATIHGYARLIARNGGAEDAASAPSREHAEAILREVGGVEKVVDDFLRYARPARLELQSLDLTALVRDLALEFRNDPRTARIDLVIEGSFPSIVGDEMLLRQAIQNLLRNAAESLISEDPAPDGEPAVEGRAEPRIVLRGRRQEGPQGGARIEIEDNGPGIQPGDLAHLFTPFFTTKERGTGLGLALVQKVAVLHDGQIEVTSRPGRGTCFTLLVPHHPGNASAAGPLA